MQMSSAFYKEENKNKQTNKQHTYYRFYRHFRLVEDCTVKYNNEAVLITTESIDV